MRYGIKGFVIDPYNKIEHKRPAGMSETEYVSYVLTKVKNFALMTDTHAWFVAHPGKPQRPKDAGSNRSQALPTCTISAGAPIGPTWPTSVYRCIGHGTIDGCTANQHRDSCEEGSLSMGGRSSTTRDPRSFLLADHGAV